MRELNIRNCCECRTDTEKRLSSLTDERICDILIAKSRQFLQFRYRGTDKNDFDKFFFLSNKCVLTFEGK